jgi:cysteinyl-tRNA synthetase|tara:strand:- start:987 stop:2345 length:1359 start_codon:yes stop_codon:yes gene_type:complete
MKIYNTLTRKKEYFKPLNGKEVGIYTCGPTVYWFAHVGNFRTYLMADLMKRVLMYNGLKVKHIMNITDVGHLTSDADSGEDKIEIAALKEGKGAEEVSKFYFDAFRKDFSKINLIEPWKWTKATDNIKEQIDLIKIIEKKGYTYKTGDGIYFDTSKDKDYGKLSKKNIEGLEEGKRIEMKEKKNKTDFALWKFSGDKKRLQEWESPWGIGFPGWHIECSAMSIKYLGKHFDIHTGGQDNMPIHHENEIAQSEAAYNEKPWVNFWMHGAQLLTGGGKMAKSSGTIKTISQLEKEGINPLAYRYFTYSAHYRKPLTWSSDAINTAANSFKRLKNIILKIENKRGLNKKYLEEFEGKINDDLDMPGALAVLWKLIRDTKADGKIETIRKMDQVFGLDLLDSPVIKVPKDIKDLADKREKARMKKDWKESDNLRESLKKKGWVVVDGEAGYSLEKL